MELEIPLVAVYTRSYHTRKVRVVFHIETRLARCSKERLMWRMNVHAAVFYRAVKAATELFRDVDTTFVVSV
jgi:hypothetical protein